MEMWIPAFAGMTVYVGSTLGIPPMKAATATRRRRRLGRSPSGGRG